MTLGSAHHGLVRCALEARALRAILRAGMLGRSPRATLAALDALRRYGPLGGGLSLAAAQHGPRTGLIDDVGALTFAELNDRATRVALALRARGACDGATVGLLCRNHRFALDTIFGAARAGARLVLLNTSFAAPQVEDLCTREGVELLVVDDDLRDLTRGFSPPLGRIGGWSDSPDSIHTLIRDTPAGRAPTPIRRGGIVMLTSGTTGTPKGAPRTEPRSVLIPGTLLDRVPFRAREVTLNAAPLFHATGFTLTLLAVGLGSTVILRRRFDPEVALEDLQRHRVTAAVLVPVLLQRLLALGSERVAAADLAALRIVFCAGSQLPAQLVDRARDALGDVVYNLYGSTEVSVATIATPVDLRAAPGCAGRAVLGTTVKILDAKGRELPCGRSGRIFVGSATVFHGYTDGGTKEQVGGLMSSGDVGHFDAAGRLFVDGRDDEMIVSGGENVFPREIEELLLRHEAIDDAAAIGVPDDEFGQRLRAFVVLAPGGRLDAAAVQSYVRDNLARFKVPRDVVFLDDLPRNPSGKVLKRTLEAIAQPGASLARAGSRASDQMKHLVRRDAP